MTTMPTDKRTDQPLLIFSEAVVVRSGKEILHVDSLTLPENEHVALLGPNGSGKSTLIKLITREIFPLHREHPPVLFQGHERIPLVEIKKHIGIVSASMQDQIAVHLPAIEVVCGGFFGSLGVPQNYVADKQTYDQCYSVMETLGIEDLARRDILTLSTGQARRVLFARALVHDPAVLVLDEPCSGLDPQGMHYVRQTMRALAQMGKTIILVSHYPEDIVPEIDRVVLLKDGRIFADGEKKQLLTNDIMSELFEAPLQVTCRNGYYSLVSEY